MMAKPKAAARVHLASLWNYNRTICGQLCRRVKWVGDRYLDRVTCQQCMRLWRRYWRNARTEPEWFGGGLGVSGRGGA